MREIKYLSPHFDLAVIGYGPPDSAWANDPNIRWLPVADAPRPTPFARLDGLLRRAGKWWPPAFDHWYWRQTDFASGFALAAGLDCDLFYANEWEALPVAARAAARWGARLIYDAHEFSPLMHEEEPKWRRYFAPAIVHILRRYGPLADASVTVAPVLVERYRTEFGFSPIVVMNAPDRVDLPERVFDPARIRMIHHGAAIADRHLTDLIDVVALCDRRYSLHLMLIEGTAGYLQTLREYADRVAPGRVRFEGPASPAQIVPRIAQYDMGLHLIPPTNYNNLIALPNKFFDFIVAGLATCVGPSPSMVDMINRYGFGCASPSFEPPAVAALLNQLTGEQIAAMQERARAAAQQINAATELSKLVNLCQGVLAGESAAQGGGR